MAAKPLSSEAIALTEKKMDMALDDIIQMSKKNGNKNKKQRVSNRSQKFVNKFSQEKSTRVRQFMDSRSSIRQGFLAQRRSNFSGNHFPLTTEAAKKAVVTPNRSRAFNQSRTANVKKLRVGPSPVQWKATNASSSVKPHINASSKQRPQTLDSLFANMKEERMRAQTQQNNRGRRSGSGQQRQQWGRGQFGN